MNQKDLLTMEEDARSCFLEMPADSRLPGMTRNLNGHEQVALSWYTAVVIYLGKKEVLTSEQINKLFPDLTTSDLLPPEEDYL